MNDYVRLVELESSYQEADGTGALGDDFMGSDDDGLPAAAAGGSRAPGVCCALGCRLDGAGRPPNALLALACFLEARG